MHQGYDHQFAVQGIQDLYNISQKGTFVTPPTPSYIHSPQHRVHQRASKLKTLAENVKKVIDENYKNKVRFVRFDQLTEFIDAVDGVHYGYNMNKALFSIYLNGMK